MNYSKITLLTFNFAAITFYRTNEWFEAKSIAIGTKINPTPEMSFCTFQSLKNTFQGMLMWVRSTITPITGVQKFVDGVWLAQLGWHFFSLRSFSSLLERISMFFIKNCYVFTCSRPFNPIVLFDKTIRNQNVFELCHGWNL